LKYYIALIEILQSQAQKKGMFVAIETGGFCPFLRDTIAEIPAISAFVAMTANKIGEKF
jgi:hypothetical protein